MNQVPAVDLKEVVERATDDGLALGKAKHPGGGAVPEEDEEVAMKENSVQEFSIKFR